MNIKLVLNSDIHKVSNKPSNFQELLEVINRTFKDKLPASYDIKYKDFEDDMIIIQDDDGFKLAYESFISEKINFLKIFIIPTKIHDTSEIRSESKSELKSQSIIIEKKNSEKTSEIFKSEKKILNSAEQKEFISFENNAFVFSDDHLNRFCLTKNFNEKDSINDQVSAKNTFEFANPLVTPFNFDDSEFAKICNFIPDSFFLTGLIQQYLYHIVPADLSSQDNKAYEINITPDIESITSENSLKCVKAFEIFDAMPKENIPKSNEAQNLEKNELILQIPITKEKEIASPLKPPLPIFPPLETLKEEESIIEEKSSEYPLKEDDEDYKNVQILEAIAGDILPKKLCIKCCRCKGTGIEQNSTKNGKACSKCVKGYLKVNKKMLKLINHILTFKLTTKYKRLLELNEEIGKGSSLLLENKENDEKVCEPKIAELDSFVCQACSGEFSHNETRYKSIEGDFYLCEKCEVECNCGLDLIKINPNSQRQALLNPSNSATVKPKNSIRKNETLSMSATSDTWSNTSLNFSSNKNNEVKAKLIGNPAPITVPMEQKFFYQFIEVCNSGTVKWPNHVFLVCVSGEFHEDFKSVPSLEKGGRYEVQLELKTPSKIGKYYSAWRLSYPQEGDENAKKFFGPRITFEINIESNETKKSEKKKINAEQWNKIPPSNNLNTFADFKIFASCEKEMVAKADQLQKIFKNHDVKYYLDFLKQSKDKEKNVEELKKIIELNAKAEQIQSIFQNHNKNFFVEFLKKSKDKDKTVNEIIELHLQTFQN